MADEFQGCHRSCISAVAGVSLAPVGLRSLLRYKMKAPAVYILASKPLGTLYVGVTGDLVLRIWQHRENLVEGFTRKYGVHRLVFYELHGDFESAILREKRLKRWNRGWKIRLIERFNPMWKDLYEDIVG